MRKIISLTLILALLITLVACGETAPKETATPTPIETKEPENKDPFLVEDDIIDSTNEIPIDYYEYVNKVCDERKEWVNSDHDFSEFEAKATMLTGDPEQLTKEEFDMLKEYKFPNYKVTKEEAIEDTVWLFKIFRSCCGAYMYYGEENFRNAESNIIEEIENNSKNDELSTYDLHDYFYDNLDFIIDSHMYLTLPGTFKSMAEANNILQYSYFGTDYIFKQDDIGYYTKIHDKKWYLESVGGNDPTDYIKVTIDKCGELAYRVVSVHNPTTTESKNNLTLSRGKASVCVDFDWKIMSVLYDYVRDVFRNGTNKESMSSLIIKNDVPILSIRYFDDIYNGEKELLTSYVASGRELKNQSTFIVDARSNGGGSNLYAREWSKNYTGSEHYYPELFCQRKTYSSGSSHIAVGDSKVSKVGTPFYEKNSNNTIFLTDKSSGSSGESIVDEFKMYNNTLIVGTNTNGCVIGGNTEYLTLPNTGIGTKISSIFLVCGDANNAIVEGIGYMPDVFVNSKEALDLSLAMIEYYGLKKSQNLDDLTLFGWDEK